MEAPVRRRGTGAYVPHGTTDRGKAKTEEARTTTKSLAHRPAQPIFHHNRKTWTGIASCDNWPLLRRLLILDQNKWDWFSLFFKMRFGTLKANKKITRSSATERSETLVYLFIFVYRTSFKNDESRSAAWLRVGGANNPRWKLYAQFEDAPFAWPPFDLPPDSPHHPPLPRQL